MSYLQPLDFEITLRNRYIPTPPNRPLPTNQLHRRTSDATLHGTQDRTPGEPLSAIPSNTTNRSIPLAPESPFPGELPDGRRSNTTLCGAEDLTSGEPLAITLSATADPSIPPAVETTFPGAQYERSDTTFTYKGTSSNRAVAMFTKAYYDIVVNMAIAEPSSTDSSVASKHWLKPGSMEMLMGIFFLITAGVLHAAPWLLPFPTEIERTLWLTCCIGMCVLPVCCAGISMVCGYHLAAYVAWRFGMAVIRVVVGCFCRSNGERERKSFLD